MLPIVGSFRNPSLLVEDNLFLLLNAVLDLVHEKASPEN
jgi:hypothetical protein